MKDIKRKAFVYLLTFLICGVIAFLLYSTFDKKDTKNENKKRSSNDNTEVIDNNEGSKELDNKTFEDKILGVEIDNKMYIIELEDSEAARNFLLLTPMTIEMEDLNGVEKYYYFNESIKGDELTYSKISKGDVMLYNGNCIVIFYNDTSNNEKYVKIGHINNLDELKEGTLQVSFVR